MDGEPLMDPNRIGEVITAQASFSGVAGLVGAVLATNRARRLDLTADVRK